MLGRLQHAEGAAMPVCEKPGPEQCPVPSPQGSIWLLKADAEQIPSPERWLVGTSPLPLA